MKTLIAYFSHTGKTRKAAELIQSACEGKLFEITGEKKYGVYVKACALAAKEIATGECPAMTSSMTDFDSYDRIVLGFPLWYGSYPHIVQTFLNTYDCSGKDVYPFCTSTSSGPEKAAKNLAAALPNATVHPTLRITDQGKNEIKEWLDLTSNQK